jgi:hypothetical protein
MGMRLGEILVQRGVMTAEQVEQLLDEQSETCRPFGVLAEERFGVSAKVVEQAWAAQYASAAPRCDPCSGSADPVALELVTRRQAWQFRVLPLRFDGPEVVLATTEADLPRAVRFGTNFIHRPCTFEICTSEQLDRALEMHFPMLGLMPELLAG